MSDCRLLLCKRIAAIEQTARLTAACQIAAIDVASLGALQAIQIQLRRSTVAFRRFANDLHFAFRVEVDFILQNLLDDDLDFFVGFHVDQWASTPVQCH